MMARAAALVLGVILCAFSTAQGQARGRDSWLVHNFGDQDLVVAITSVEYGVPDRWSFTSRYVHMFDRDRDQKAVLHNFTVTLSPGTAGGRLGVGYENIYSHGKTAAGKGEGFELLSEARAVLLRTWGNPLETQADRTFGGIELRASLGGVFIIGVGRYAPVGAGNGARAFWGWHAGVGL